MTEPQPHAGYEDAADSVGRDHPLDLVDLVASSRLDGESEEPLPTEGGLDQAAVAARAALFRALGEQARAELPILASDEDRVGVSLSTDSRVQPDAVPQVDESAQAAAIGAALAAGGFVSAPTSLADRRRHKMRRAVQGTAAAAAIVVGLALAPRLFDKVEHSFTASDSSSRSAESAGGGPISVTATSAALDAAQREPQADSQATAAGQSVGSDKATNSSSDPRTDSADVSSVSTTIARQGDVTSTVVASRPVPADAGGVMESSPAAQSDATSTDSVAYGPEPTFATWLISRTACVSGLQHGSDCG